MPQSERGFLGAVDDIMIEQDERSQGVDTLHMVDITVDSGAAEAVASPSFAPPYTVRSSAGSHGGTKYRTASGNLVST